MSPIRFLSMFSVAVLATATSIAPARAIQQASTFSIVAYDSVTQELGVAVQSRYFSVGRTVPWVLGGVGAVATQSNVNPSFGPQALAMMRQGMSPDEIMKAFAATDAGWDGRQLGIVDAHGRAATYTGKTCQSWAGGETGVHFACQGNILAGPAVVADMAKAFRATRGELGDRLVAVIEAAQAAGGDSRGQQSAALIIVRPSERHPEFRERYVDLRIEDHETPVVELRRLWRIHQGFHGAGAHLAMAEEYEAGGNTALARLERERVGAILTDAVARDERDTSILNGLAWSCAIHDMNLPEALEAAERAAAIEPKSTDILDTLAEVHYRMGNAKKALEVERRAAQLAPDNAYLKGQIERFEAGKP